MAKFYELSLTLKDSYRKYYKDELYFINYMTETGGKKYITTPELSKKVLSLQDINTQSIERIVGGGLSYDYENSRSYLNIEYNFVMNRLEACKSKVYIFKSKYNKDDIDKHHPVAFFKGIIIDTIEHVLTEIISQKTHQVLAVYSRAYAAVVGIREKTQYITDLRESSKVQIEKLKDEFDKYITLLEDCDFSNAMDGDFCVLKQTRIELPYYKEDPDDGKILLKISSGIKIVDDENEEKI